MSIAATRGISARPLIQRSELVWVSCPHLGDEVIDRYSDAVHCGDCGAELVAATPGRFQLDYDYACGLIDVDEYLERLDALLGHP